MKIKDDYLMNFVLWKGIIKMKEQLNIISNEELAKLLKERDSGMQRVHITTELRKKQLQAKTIEEYFDIPIPPIYSLNSDGQPISHEMHQMIDIFIDQYCRGYNMDHEGRNVCQYGNLGSVVSSTLFRGERKDYGSECTSLLGRNCRSHNKISPGNAFLEFVVAQMRIYLFHGFLTCFREYQEFPFATPMPHVIAQHYGIPTQFLDLTDDIKVALFFACCKYDKENHRYLPISEHDLSDLGEYAVLYCGEENFNTTAMIGYQPFTRCFKQRGYYIDTAQECFCWDFSLEKNAGFTKNLFHRTPKLCQQIYDEFDGGEILFPKDSLYECNCVIDEIGKATSFPKEVFEIIVECAESYLMGYVNFDPRNGLSTKDWLYKELVASDKIKLTDKYIISDVRNIVEKYNSNWNITKYQKEHDIIAWGRESVTLPNGDFMWSLPFNNNGIFTGEN